MEELIEKLKNIHGLNAEQSIGILNTIKNFVKEKFPMVGGAIDNILPSTTPSSTSLADAQPNVSASHESGDFLDKISDFIPGATGQKIEDIAKDKLGGFFK